MNYNEYDELICSFYSILSTKASFNTQVSAIFDKLKELSNSSSRSKLQGYFINLAESHERQADTRKNITRTYCMLSECVVRAEHLNYGECFLDSDRIRLSTTKDNLSMMFTVARAKFYDRFKQEINTTLKKSRVFDEYFEKNRMEKTKPTKNRTHRKNIPNDGYSKDKFTCPEQEMPKVNTKVRLSASKRKNLLDALDYEIFSDALDGDNSK